MLGWITTWNEQCGIAVHSENILYHLEADYIILAPENVTKIREDEGFVHRCWNKKSSDFTELISTVVKEDVDVVMIQHHPGFMLFGHLNILIGKLVENGITVSLILHNTKERPLIYRINRVDKAVNGMRLCRNVIVHQKGDVSRLKEIGVDGNVDLLPHGVYPPPSNRDSMKIPEGRVLGTFGFMFRHKGFPELIRAFSSIKNWDYLVMLCSVREDSQDALVECEKEIERLGLGDRVLLNTEFLDQEYAISTLSKLDLVVFPYQNTKESASGAVRMAVAAGTAIAVTHLEIFDDVEGTIILNGLTDDDIASSLESLNEGDLGRSQKRIIQMRDANQWNSVTSRIVDLLGI